MSNDAREYETYTELIIAALNLQQVRLYNENHPENRHADADEEQAEDSLYEAAIILIGNIPPPVEIPAILDEDQVAQIEAVAGADAPATVTTTVTTTND